MDLLNMQLRPTQTKIFFLKPIVQDGKAKYQSMHYHIKPSQYKYPKSPEPNSNSPIRKGKRMSTLQKCVEYTQQSQSKQLPEPMET